MFSASAVFCDDRSSPESATESLKFLKRGKPVESGSLTSTALQSYIDAIRTHPDFKSCVTRKNKNGDFYRLDYEKISSLIELEVCLFWSAQYYIGMPQMKAFFESSGFTIDKTTVYPRSAMLRFGKDDDGVLLTGNMRSENIPNSLKSAIDHILPPHSLSIGVLLDSDSRPIDTTAIFNRI
jgi:hypothetical protein